MPLLSRGGSRATASTDRSLEWAADPLKMAADPEAEKRGDWQVGARARGRSALFETCSNTGCSSGWLHLWRSRATPVFEGGWNCSSACTAARVESAVRRELDGRGQAQESHHHRVPLGLVMLEAGLDHPSPVAPGAGGAEGGWSRQAGLLAGASAGSERAVGDPRAGPAVTSISRPQPRRPRRRRNGSPAAPISRSSRSRPTRWGRPCAGSRRAAARCFPISTVRCRSPRSPGRDRCRSSADGRHDFGDLAC